MKLFLTNRMVLETQKSFKCSIKLMTGASGIGCKLNSTTGFQAILKKTY